MPYKQPVILRSADIARAEVPMAQRLNPRSAFRGSWLSSAAGLQRAAVSLARIPPGGESFAYHAHLAQEEWIYILSGRARGRFDGVDHELGQGDFAAFPAPQAPHVLQNPYAEDCVYLMGGERGLAADVLDYPELQRRYVLLREAGRVAFHRLGPAEYPFGRADAPPPADTAPPLRLLSSRGCGSAIVEAAMTLCGVPFEREEIDYATPGPQRDRLLAANPIGQVPTVIFPDGSVMTESAAIVLHLDEIAPGAGLLPSAGDPLRKEALRWLVLFVAALYPTFTYGDHPARWIGAEAGPALREATDAHREGLWRDVERAVRGPYFLGPRFSALDLYVAVMTHWRPGRPWFACECPKLAAIAASLDGHPHLAKVWSENFPT
jgi:GST-like protein